jgi:hypothetical protein
MSKHALRIALALGLAAAAWSPALAHEYNNKRPFLPSSGQVKINSARAKMFAVQSELEKKAKEAEKTGQNSCPDGVFVDRSNPRREVIIATKDIVNLGGQLDLNAACR